MFDIGWTEMAVIALLALIVIGPKDLPKVLRTMGQWVRKARGLTREFQSGLDDMIREAELDEAKKAVETGKDFNVKKAIKDSVDPTGELEDEGKAIERETRSDVDDGAAASNVGATSNAAKPDSAAESDGEQEKRATVVKHPLQQAPGNSVKPPEETAPAGNGASASSSGESSAKTEKPAGKPAAKESSG